MKKKNKGIKICVYGGLTALALTGTMVLCHEMRKKEMQPQESVVSSEETCTTKKIMVATEKILIGYDEQGNALYKTVPVYDYIVIEPETSSKTR